LKRKRRKPRRGQIKGNRSAKGEKFKEQNTTVERKYVLRKTRNKGPRKVKS